jgi:hypothetical protein
LIARKGRSSLTMALYDIKAVQVRPQAQGRTMGGHNLLKLGLAAWSAVMAGAFCAHAPINGVGAVRPWGVR